MARTVKIPEKEEKGGWTIASAASLFFLVLILAPSAAGVVEKVMVRFGYWQPSVSDPTLSVKEMRVKIDEYYQRRNPEKLKEEGYDEQALKLAKKYRTAPKALWEKLEKKYGKDRPPTELQLVKDTFTKAMKGDKYSLLSLISGTGIILSVLSSCIFGDKKEEEEKEERKRKRKEEKEAQASKKST
mmetsp:Transcript_26881/g.32646  ORF Transcript_26881/g.32646 Transcript_26881/m.32646 type:complete len:186 (-) Transcript_26881:900-1457(-)|eukprot:CAMPEP_0197853810 /NCGR_PEP_ID=MMETSP1438-20131217/23470_1 /TAXON_ID=1461541 /ORGANISM="Pterosperma sp., Strain CCMP1384" /LENGTH=185 /DNA_ID=CAMNT_0043468345 /DNA_START=319 /DNA_END=876 /DNA_ORIENTATION=+